MKAIFSFITVALCGFSPLFAQAPAIQWQNTIGGNEDDKLTSIQQTADGGYILGGYSESNISGDKTENSLGGFYNGDYWVVKLSATGAIQWQNTISGNHHDELTSLQQTADGGYILGGWSNSDISGDKTENSWGDYDYWVLKLDPTGAIQWQNTIGGNGRDKLTSLQQTVDGGYILGGHSNSNISGDKTENSLGNDGHDDYWVLKLNATGAIQWQNAIGGHYGETFTSLQQTADGGYILGGYSWSDATGDKTESSWGEDYWVVKLNATGAIQWQNTIGGDGYDWLYSLQQTADGGYILGGYSESKISGDKTENCLGGFLNGDYWVLKLNAAGAIQWQNTIGGSGRDEFASLKQTTDGGYILGGTSDSNISGDKTENSLLTDYWVLKLNANGVIQWQNTIGGDSFEAFASLQETADGGYILGGSSSSDISGDKTENSLGGGFIGDYWVIKLASETVPTEEAGTTPASVTIYPNPAADAIFVQTDAETTLSLCNAFGQTLLTQTFRGNGKIDLSSLPNGIYFLVEMETGVGHKILKNK